MLNFDFMNNQIAMIGVYFIVGTIVFIIASYIVSHSIQKSQKNRIESIELGMSEDEMLGIMGKGYNKSLLKDGRVKYEWRYSNESSTGYSYAGVSTRKYHGVRKATVYCKDGFVEEVKPFNM